MTVEKGIRWERCLNCGKTFVPKTDNQEFCEPRCGEEYIKKKKFLGTRRRQIRRSKHDKGEQSRLT